MGPNAPSLQTTTLSTPALPASVPAETEKESTCVLEWVYMPAFQKMDVDFLPAYAAGHRCGPNPRRSAPVASVDNHSQRFGTRLQHLFTVERLCHLTLCNSRDNRPIGAKQILPVHHQSISSLFSPGKKCQGWAGRACFSWKLLAHGFSRRF